MLVGSIGTRNVNDYYAIFLSGEGDFRLSVNISVASWLANFERAEIGISGSRMAQECDYDMMKRQLHCLMTNIMIKSLRHNYLQIIDDVV